MCVCVCIHRKNECKEVVFSCVTDFLIKCIIENEITYKCP